jgi:ketosteroid isomerase-like protein
MGTKYLCAVLSVVVAGLACEHQKQSEQQEVAAQPTSAAQPSVAEVQPKAAEPSKPLEGEALANRYVSCWNLYNDKEWQRFGECYSEDAVSTFPDSGQPELKGRDAIVEANGKKFTAAFSDAKGSAELVLVNGRQVASIALLTGTNDGPVAVPGRGQIAATNKQLGQHVFRAAKFDQNNQVEQETRLRDLGSMLSQLGQSEAPGRAADMAPSAGSPNIVVAKNDATEQANVDLIRKSFQDLEKEDAEAIEAVLADDIVESDQAAPEDLKGKQAVLDSTKTFLGAMGDIAVQCPSVWGAGDYVVSNCNLKAKNDGDMGKRFKKTGKPVDVTVVEIAKVSDGKIQELWRFMNSVAFAQQLGLLPPPEVANADVTDKAAPPTEPAKGTPAEAAPAGAPKPAAAEAPKDLPVSGQK